MCRGSAALGGWERSEGECTHASVGVRFKCCSSAAQATASPSSPAAALPLHACRSIDASDVPAAYILAILSQCGTFPQTLIFFLRGNLSVRYLWMQHQAQIDTYFLVSCASRTEVTNGTVSGAGSSWGSGAEPPLLDVRPGGSGGAAAGQLQRQRQAAGPRLGVTELQPTGSRK